MKRFLTLALLLPSLVSAQETFKTWVVVSGTTENTSVHITLPNEKKPQEVKVGQKFEIAYDTTKADRFHVSLQMNTGHGTINPCEIDVEQLTQFDRSYVCTTQDPYRKVTAQVQLRVYTNLNGGDKIEAKQLLAHK